MFGHDLADQPPIVGVQLAAMRACNLAALARELAGLPTLVLGAAHDPIAPPHAGRVIAFAGSRSVELPDAWHGAPIQCPGPVNDLLAEHLATADEARRAAGLP